MKKTKGKPNSKANGRTGTPSKGARQSRNGSSHAAASSRTISRGSSSRAKASSRQPISMKWLNDFLSEMLAVEEGGIKLYQKALDELQHEELRDKLEEFHEETQRHVELVQEMMEAAGMDLEQKSPGAEAAEHKAEGLLSTEVEEELSDMNNIENLVLAETKDHWDWEMLSSIVGRIGERELKDVVRSAVSEVFKQEREHLQWNQDRLTELAMEMAEQQDESETGDEAVQDESAQSEE
jgi:rubrerythrin